MARIEWDEDSYSVKVSEIDNQHKHLFKLHNDYHESLLNDNFDKLVVTRRETLRRLVEYTKQHFFVEEKLMVESRYPDAQMHIEDHRLFANKVNGLLADELQGRMVLPTSVMKILRSWIVEHVTKDDKKAGEFLSRKK